METMVKILPNEGKPPTRKLADAELHFHGGELDCVKLTGFAIWRRSDREGFDVTFPSREFTVDGHRRRYALLRAIGDPVAQDRVRDLVVRAYANYEASARGAMSDRIAEKRED